MAFFEEEFDSFGIEMSTDLCHCLSGAENIWKTKGVVRIKTAEAEKMWMQNSMDELIVYMLVDSQGRNEEERAP